MRSRDRMRAGLIAIQILFTTVLTGGLAYRGWVRTTRGSRVSIQNELKTGEKLTFSCPPGEIYLVNVTSGDSYNLKVPKRTQDMWCVFVRELGVYWDCKGVIELQLTCRTAPMECESHQPIYSITFTEDGVMVNGERKVHSKWVPLLNGQHLPRNLDTVIDSEQR